jgi:hypothetical protein
MNTKIEKKKLELLSSKFFVQPSINSINDLKTVMEHHVFAVWDFMCLAKSLQGLIAPTSNPWLPQMEPNGVRLINEIILAEESDILPDGTYLSHFELYIKAMKDVGADTRPILGFLDKVKNDGVPNALQSQYISPIAKRFMSLTFEQIATNCPWIVCASFTHGRESIVPLMFQEIRKSNVLKNQSCVAFDYYLERHIDVDGGEEGHAAMAAILLDSLCKGSEKKIEEAEMAALFAIEARIRFWTEIHDILTSR